MDNFYGVLRECRVRKLYCITVDEAARKNARPQHRIVVRSRPVRGLRHYRTITRIDAESTYENIPFYQDITVRSVYLQKVLACWLRSVTLANKAWY